MATHTTSGSGDYARKFSIGRENGTADKNGRPHFFEWLQSLPTESERKGRKFETRLNGAGEQRHYELFTAISGILTHFGREERTINGVQEMRFILHLRDGAEDYTIDCGSFDGRYSMDIMKRLLDPQFNPKQNLRLSPFARVDNDGKVNMGISAMSGMDAKLTAAREKNPRLEGMAQATSAQFKDRLLWDFSPVAEWLYHEMKRWVDPQLSADPFAPKQAGEPTDKNWPTEAPPVTQEVVASANDFDDLPF